ncbi:uncharacterized protein BDR25DRAFT_385792 [Lindgomyces ingoldianus]|uniref:Uncharacterized protein n=1 Tax=Lindgomyces ingoldianus TaxID=673940 RepID=A0ACB6R5F0_9PLEO|nr:uncharacterized protein BDR25DRAFT_385792 [Lindgomyces ingoldianus]KAF2474315.1 hypothetical protein BDR25DRAFT_385792 [Lindgomyces ingoldianus]
MDISQSPGITIHLSPAQIFIVAGLLGAGRLFSQLARHLLFRRTQLTVKSAKHGGESLFAPVVTSSYTPLLDIDYNLHKSNSTFFNDLDDNRTELMLALFKDVVQPLARGKETLKPKMFNLGGTSCIFKKAIPPFAHYEISSRVLCWDEKWIYVVSHFTKSGSNKPTRFLVSPPAAKASPFSDTKKFGDQQDRIYATAITKYVFKAGRVTCPPESVMLECGLFPSKPSSEQTQGFENITANAKKERDCHWSWEEVQNECQKHLELAQNFGSLDQLHGAFIGRSGPAMYTY